MPGRKKAAAAAPDFAQWEPAVKLEVLTQLYVKNIGAEPKYPETITNLKTKPELAAAQADFLSQELHRHIAIADGDLTALGQQRAQAVQRALLTDTQIDPERVFLAVSDKAKNEAGLVRLELTLK